MKRISRYLAALAAALMLAAPAMAVEEIPVEDFFKRSLFTSFQLSPDGKYLAAVTPLFENERRNIAVIDLETRKARAVTSVKDRDVSGYMWANNERILFFMDKDGNESFGIFAVNKDGTRPKVLIEPAETQIRGGSRFVRTASVINRLDDDKSHVLVSTPRIDGNKVVQDVQVLNILSGRTAIVERNPGDIQGYLTSDEGDVIGALRIRDGKRSVLWRDGEDAEWETLVTYEASNGGFMPVWISDDGDRMYVRSNMNPDGSVRDKAAIYEYNFQNKELGRLIFEHPEVDVAGVVGSEAKDAPVMVTYNAAKLGYHFLDEEWERMMESVQAAFPDRKVSISSRTEDEDLLVLATWSDRNPPAYYLFDRETNRMEELATAFEWLPVDALAEMQPVEIEARDGLVLPGYLTLPPDSDGKDLPMVLNVHGGPWARDSWGFNQEVQLMANRGYAVLQVNFRSSEGYGLEFRNAGRKQWGLKMQDDLTDAVYWAIEQGIADPDRICIYGASYGGYAAMAGATFTPELYQCAINYVGVTDIPLLFDSNAAWRLLRPELVRDVGDPEADRELLDDRSPVNHADKIRVPILMGYGKQDVRVTIEHALRMEEQLKLHEVEHELIIKDDEGHGFRKFENQVDWYSRVIEFLDENLKAAEENATLSSTAAAD
ncbi:S9 family peptidase [Lentisalinibacter sediminis]|uniref:S9 family peptidase n=1 Tax=Lentisalinibacter sediminis TaxID=2992237 RepID=UPI00386927C2